MPIEDVKEAIAKLIVELNHPVDANVIAGSEMLPSERTKSLYNTCKERGDLYYFWQFHNAFISETGYIIAQNPELFFSKISDEAWQAFITAIGEKNNAMRELAKYDTEMSTILQMYETSRVCSSDEEMEQVLASIESAKQYYTANKDKYISKRKAFLQ